jgi:uncharacterized membrane protein
MEENKQEMKVEEGKGSNIGMAVVAYFIFFVPLLTEYKNDPLVKYHVKQSLLLTLAFVACSFARIIPFFGWMIASFVPMLIGILWIFGLINSINGEQKPVPVIGKYAEQWFKF